MSSISHQVREWLLAHPSEEKLVAERLINASALARKIKLDLQSHKTEPISVKAITLAVGRYSRVQKPTPQADEFRSYIEEISIQSEVSLMVIPHADLDIDGFAKAIAILHKTREFAFYTRGIRHITLVTNKGIVEELRNHFRYELITHDLVALTIKLKPGNREVTGLYASILQKIAGQNSNLQEVISSHTELTIVVAQADSHKVVNCLI